MTPPKARRRRGLLLLAFALLCGVLAAARVNGQAQGVGRGGGSAVAAVVAARDLTAGARLGASALSVRRVPASYLPPGTVTSLSEAVGARLATSLPRGAYLTAGALGGGTGSLRRGQRAVEIAVSGGQALGAATTGTRVDVVISTEPRDRPGRSFVALENIELLALRQGTAGQGGDDGAARTASATATLRVSLKQAVYLSAAENYAREIRLLPRPPDDRARRGHEAVAAGDL
jgi:pilus assembly protein CpaB